MLPVQWVDAQQKHYLSLNRLESGKRWASALIIKLWNIAWDLWDNRNYHTHHSNEETINQQLNNELHALLSRGSITPDTQSLFSDTEKVKLSTATAAYKKAWIAMVRAREGYHKRKHRTELSRMRNTLRMFLSKKS